MGEFPTAIKSMLARQVDIAELAVEAAVEGSYTKALQALAIDPIVTDLNFARNYLNDILAAHKDLLPNFK
jgi:6-phospho-beta-glucosidase